MPVPVLGAAIAGLAAGVGMKVIDYAIGNDADSQTRLSAQLGQQNWEQQFNMQNEYEAPINQVARLKEAGINPYLGSSQISTGSSGSLSPSYSPPASHYQSMSETMNQSMAAYKALEEGSVTKPLAEADIDAKRAESALNRVRADREQLNYSLDQEFGKSERDQALKNKVQEFMNMQEELEKLHGEARLLKAQENLEYLKGIQQVFENKTSEYNASITKKILDNTDARLQSEIDVMKSEQAKNFASAGESSANAKKLQIENEVQGKLRDWFMQNQVKNMENYIQKLVTDGWISAKDAEEALERAKNAHDRNASTAYRFINYLLDKINVGSAVVFPVKK